MPECPVCRKPLEPIRQREGVFYPCRSCNGRALTVTQVRHVLGEDLAMKLLRLIKLTTRTSERLCPFCSQPMRIVNSQEPLIEVDMCRKCNVVWFDEPTYKSLPELGLEGTNSMLIRGAEVLATQRLDHLNRAMEEDEAKRKGKKRRRPLSDSESENDRT